MKFLKTVLISSIVAGFAIQPVFAKGKPKAEPAQQQVAAATESKSSQAPSPEDERVAMESQFMERQLDGFMEFMHNQINLSDAQKTAIRKILKSYDADNGKLRKAFEASVRGNLSAEQVEKMGDMLSGYPMPGGMGMGMPMHMPPPMPPMPPMPAEQPEPVVPPTEEVAPASPQ
jgi:hypothetical protein